MSVQTAQEHPFERLPEVAAALTGAAGLPEIAQVITQQVTEALGGTGAFLVVRSEDGQFLEMVGTTGFPEAALDGWRRFPVSSQTPLAEAVRSGQPVWPETSARRVERYPHLAESYARASGDVWLSLPLALQGRVVGGLAVTLPAGRDLNDVERRLALSLATMCAGAVERGRLRVAEQRAAKSAAELAAEKEHLFREAEQRAEDHARLGVALREAAEARDAALIEANAERQRLRTLFNDAPALIALTRGPDHVFELVNAAFMRMVGIRNVVGLPASRALPELKGHGLIARLNRAYQTGQVQTLPELTVGIDRNGDGRIDDDERAVVNAVFQPYRDPDGQVAGLLIHAAEVTEQVRAREALVESEARLRLALRASGMGIWEWDVRTGAITWTEKVAELHGLAPDAYDGTFDAWAVLIHPDDRERVLSRVEQALHERAWYEVEFRVVWPDGSVHWLATQGQAMYDQAGKPTRMVGGTFDVTSRHG